MERIIKNWIYGEQLIVYVNSDQIIDDTRQCTKFYVLGEVAFIYLDGKILEKPYQGDCEFSNGGIWNISENGRLSYVRGGCNEEVDIYTINKCNSNCIMCPVSEYERKREVAFSHYAWIERYIDILPSDVEFITITGGEPTLAMNNLLLILEKLSTKFNYTEFQMLTNGRSFCKREIVEKVINHAPNNMKYAIPVHSSREDVHDKITQAQGSFKQTDQGIKNLLKLRQNVEIRIVISKLNIDTFDETIVYICENYKSIMCVNVIAMEMMGNAAVNRDVVWVDYKIAFQKCRTGLNKLIEAGIDVHLYNFPLCVIDKGYWFIASKSISDYKVRYMEECNDCKVKEICGGFFESTKQLMNPLVEPVV